MRALFALVLIAGLGLAGFAVYMAQGFLATMRAENQELLRLQAENPTTIPILVASAPVNYAFELDPEQLTSVRWEKDKLPDGYFLDLEAAQAYGQRLYQRIQEGASGAVEEEFEELKELIKQAAENPLHEEGQKPRFVLRRIEKHEPILAVHVTEPGEPVGITSLLQEGYRAFAIPVDVESGVSGFLRPGDYVDVYWTGNGATDGFLGNSLTRLIQSRVKLIAVDQVADTGRTGTQLARTVTVEATPEQVARLTQARSTGRLSLSLVGTGDESEVIETVEVDLPSLLNIEREVEVVEEVKEKCYMWVRRGAERVQGPEIACSTN